MSTKRWILDVTASGACDGTTPLELVSAIPRVGDDYVLRMRGRCGRLTQTDQGFRNMTGLGGYFLRVAFENLQPAVVRWTIGLIQPPPYDGIELAELVMRGLGPEIASLQPTEVYVPQGMIVVLRADDGGDGEESIVGGPYRIALEVSTLPTAADVTAAIARRGYVTRGGTLEGGLPQQFQMVPSTLLTTLVNPHSRRGLVGGTMAGACIRYTVATSLTPRVITYSHGGYACDPRIDVLAYAGCALITVPLPPTPVSATQVAVLTALAVNAFGDDASNVGSILTIDNVTSYSLGQAAGPTPADVVAHAEAGLVAINGNRGRKGIHQYLGAPSGPATGTFARRIPILDETGNPYPPGTRIRIKGAFLYGSAGSPITLRMAVGIGPAAGLLVGNPPTNLAFSGIRQLGFVTADDDRASVVPLAPALQTTTDSPIWVLFCDDGTNGPLLVGAWGGGSPQDAYYGDYAVGEQIIRVAADNDPAIPIGDGSGNYTGLFAVDYDGFELVGVIVEVEPFAASGGCWIAYGPQWAYDPALGLTISLADECVAFRAPSIVEFEQIAKTGESVGVATYNPLDNDDIGSATYNFTDLAVPSVGVDPLIYVGGPLGISAVGRNMLTWPAPIEIGGGLYTGAVGAAFVEGINGGGVPVSQILYYSASGFLPGGRPYWLVPDRTWSDYPEEPDVYAGAVPLIENRAFLGAMPINDPAPAWPATWQAAVTDTSPSNFLDTTAFYVVDPIQAIP